MFTEHLHQHNKFFDMAKKSQFSIFDNSADSADFHDPQIRKGVYGSFWPFSKILNV